MRTIPDQRYGEIVQIIGVAGVQIRRPGQVADGAAQITKFPIIRPGQGIVSRVFGVSISNLPQHAETSFIFAISVKGQRQIEAQCFGSLRILRKTKRFIKLRNGSPVVLALRPRSTPDFDAPERNLCSVLWPLQIRRAPDHACPADREPHPKDCAARNERGLSLRARTNCASASGKSSLFQ